MRKGKRHVGRFLCMDLITAQRFRFGITASTHYGNAVERNRFKRLVRESIRLLASDLPPKIELHVVPRQRAKGATLPDIRNEIFELVMAYESQSVSGRGRPHN